MRVRIIPAHGYVHGHAENLLLQQGIAVPVRRPDGIVEVDLTEQQIATFQLKGNAHRLERLAEGDVSAPAAAPVPQAAAAPVAPVVESAFVTLECPLCHSEFNLVKMLAPGGNVETNCSQCGAFLTIEGFNVTTAQAKHTSE